MVVAKHDLDKHIIEATTIALSHQYLIFGKSKVDDYMIVP
jgi:hypothetical protein